MMIGPLEFNVFYSSLPGPRAGAGAYSAFTGYAQEQGGDYPRQQATT